MLTKIRAKTRQPLLHRSAVRHVATILRALHWLLGDLSVVDYDDNKEVLTAVSLTDEVLNDLARSSIASLRDAVDRYAYLFKGRLAQSS